MTKAETQKEALSTSTIKTIDEILLQLKNRKEILQGVEATIIEHVYAYQRGDFIKKKTRKEQQSPIQEDLLDDLFNPNEVLKRAKTVFKDMPCNQRNEILLRAIPKSAKKFDPPTSFVDTIILMKKPAKLLRFETKVENLPWWLKWLRIVAVKSLDAGVEYVYFQEVPLPKKISIRVKTRGIGPLRYGVGEDTEIWYKTK